LPFKLAGQLLKPLAGALEQAIAESQGDSDELLAQVESALRMDPRARDLLGPNAEVGSVFSSASSSSSVNGQTQRNLQLQFQVGGGAVGAAQGSASTGGAIQLQTLRLNVGGREINVDILGGAASGGADGSADGIIDVEVL